jgi:hypothetical protein
MALQIVSKIFSKIYLLSIGKNPIIYEFFISLLVLISVKIWKRKLLNALQL